MKPRARRLSHARKTRMDGETTRAGRRTTHAGCWMIGLDRRTMHMRRRTIRVCSQAVHGRRRVTNPRCRTINVCRGAIRVRRGAIRAGSPAIRARPRVTRQGCPSTRAGRRAIHTGSERLSWETKIFCHEIRIFPNNGTATGSFDFWVCIFLRRSVASTPCSLSLHAPSSTQEIVRIRIPL